MGARAIFRGFNRPSRVLMINQFGINIGFYMLMPYLADYLAGPLGLAAWAVGLVMGVRNFSQQGMFFVGGTLADRFGYKPLIIAGCLIRTGGFALLVVAQSLPSVLIAAAATGFAGALFNPAVRGYLAAEAGERKIEAFAMFNVFYQSGILLGPLVGLVLLALDFRITVLAAAGVFGLLTVAQLVALPQHRADSEREKTSILQDWRVVVRNRPFLTLAAAMTGCYALSFQIYLALPMQASILMPRNQYLLIAAMFAVSGLVAVGGQLRITRWFAVRWGAERSLVVGATIWRPRSSRLQSSQTASGSASPLRSWHWCCRRVCWRLPRQRCFLSKCVPWSHCRATGWWRPTTGSTAPSWASESSSEIWRSDRS